MIQPKMKAAAIEGWQSTLLAAAHLASAAASDMVEAVRDGEVWPGDNIGSGDTLHILADATRLLIEATADAKDEAAMQLLAALASYIGEVTGLLPAEGEVST